jgi:hypothetical protein
MNNNLDDDMDLAEEDRAPHQEHPEACDGDDDSGAAIAPESSDFSSDPAQTAEEGPLEDNETASAASEAQPLTEVSLTRSRRGRVAHFMGALVAAVLGKQIGADRPERFSNHHVLDGKPFQIRTISGTQNTFTVNPVTEPDRIIVAAKCTRESTEDVSCYRLFGVLTADAIAVGRKSGSRGHIKSAHLQVSLTGVNQTCLGEARIVPDLITAERSEERLQLLEAIDGLVIDQGVLDVATLEKIRAFICDAGNQDATGGEMRAMAELVENNLICPFCEGKKFSFKKWGRLRALRLEAGVRLEIDNRGDYEDFEDGEYTIYCGGCEKALEMPDDWIVTELREQA